MRPDLLMRILPFASIFGAIYLLASRPA